MATAKACCEREPVAGTYSPEGTYRDIGGIKSYVTGSADVKRGIVLIYDVFGFAPQTVQGADLLATYASATVVMPDLCKGECLDISKTMSMTAEERTAAVGKLLAGAAATDPGVKGLLEYRKALGADMSHVQGWGVAGLCWGGKIAVRATSTVNNTDRDKGFRASGQAHGSILDGADAEECNVPHVFLASSDEPEDKVEAYREALGQQKRKEEGREGVVQLYEGMFHGWMGARADLGNAENKKQFQAGYCQLAEFFSKYL